MMETLAVAPPKRGLLEYAPAAEGEAQPQAFEDDTS